MRRGKPEVVVGAQHGQLVPQAQLRQQGVIRAHLHTRASTAIAQFRGSDMILSVRRQQRQGSEPVNDVLARTWSSEALQQLLQDEPGRQNRIPTFECIVQSSHLWGRRGLITAEGKRPDAGIDEQAHPRERSAL